MLSFVDFLFSEPSYQLRSDGAEGTSNRTPTFDPDDIMFRFQNQVNLFSKTLILRPLLDINEGCVSADGLTENLAEMNARYDS